MAYNLLLVDDSAIVRKVISKTLAMANISVGNLIEAENGKVALEKLKENWVDLVLLDINMPIMNGIEFMEALSQDEVLRSTPVVVVSTEGSSERIDRLNELGIRAYLRKPFTPEALAEALGRILDQVEREKNGA